MVKVGFVMSMSGGRLSENRGGTGREGWSNGPGLNRVSRVGSLWEFRNMLGKSRESTDLFVLQVVKKNCMACKAMERKVRRLAQTFPQVKFLELDYAQNEADCKALGVLMLPHFEVHDALGAKLDGFSCGWNRATVLQEKLEQFISRSRTRDPN